MRPRARSPTLVEFEQVPTSDERGLTDEPCDEVFVDDGLPTDQSTCNSRPRTARYIRFAVIANSIVLAAIGGVWVALVQRGSMQPPRQPPRQPVVDAFCVYNYKEPVSH